MRSDLSRLKLSMVTLSFFDLSLWTGGESLASQYGDPFLLSPDPILPSTDPEDRWVNAPQLVRADLGAHHGDPFLLSPEPEDMWVNVPQLVRADLGAHHGDPFLLSSEPEDMWVNAPQLVYGLTWVLIMVTLSFSHLSLRICG